MLVREMIELNRKGLIPQFMKDAWTKKHGDEFPTMETGGILRLVRIDAWINAVLPDLVVPFLMISMISLCAFLLTHGNQWVTWFALGWCPGWCLMTLIVSILPRSLTFHVQSYTKTNYFNCSLTNVLKWMKMKPDELVKFSHFELSHFADEVLIGQAKEIIRLENLGGWMNDVSRACRDARDHFRFMYDILGHFGFVSDPWDTFFLGARERIAKAEKEAKEKAKTSLTKAQCHEAWATLNEFCFWAWESAGIPNAQMCLQYLGETHPTDSSGISIPNLLGLKWWARKANGKPTLKFRFARLRYFVKMGLKTDHLWSIDTLRVS